MVLHPLPKDCTKQHTSTNNNSDDSQLMNLFCIIVIAHIPVMLINYGGRLITIHTILTMEALIVLYH